MTQKPSERPLWFWPLVGLLAPIGVGGFFLLVQWTQWESGNQKERLARERAEQDLREKLDQLTKLRGGQGFSKADADFAFTKDQEERLNSDGNSVESQPEEVKATSADNLNTHVGDNLNAADNLFKEGMDGCPSVSIAIMAANSPQIYGPTSESQKAELRTYAQRCGLRF